MIQRRSYEQRYKGDSTCEASSFLFFSPIARKNINLHYITIIMIKTSSLWLSNICHYCVSSTVNIHTIYCITYYLQTIFQYWRHTEMTLWMILTAVNMVNWENTQMFQLTHYTDIMFYKDRKDFLKVESKCYSKQVLI